MTIGGMGTTLLEPNGRLKPKPTLYLGFAVSFCGAVLITLGRIWPDPAGYSDRLSLRGIFVVGTLLIVDGSRRLKREGKDLSLSEDLSERPGQTLVPYRGITYFIVSALSVAFVAYGSLIYQRARETPKYNSARICSGASEQKYDFRNDENRKEIVLTLRDGCFDRYIDVPSSWRGWEYKPVGNPAKWWMAIWYSGWNTPRGPYLAVDKPDFNAPQLRLFRLQGHGQIRLYPKYSDGPPPQDTEGIYSSRDGITNPVPLAQTEPRYTKAAREAHFEGDVTATAIVGEDGTLRAIRIVESPGYGLDQNVIECLQGWKFKPGERDGKPVPVRATVTVKFRLNP